MTCAPIVAHVQVRESVRRPVSATTFMATDVQEGDAVVRMRGHWRDSTEVRSYVLPWGSIIALRWLGEAQG